MLKLISTQTPAESNVFDETSSTSNRTVYGSHKDIYEDITILKPLTDTSSSTYLVKSQITKLNYAMKIYKHNNGRIPLHFKNRIRFTSLRHPNIIRNLYSQQERETMIDGTAMNIAYAIMEHASNGDFMSLLKEKACMLDEKIIRTYFKQLIEGIEYLHKSGVTHGDLKLDNLLISDDFTLKISDFDVAHYTEDCLILSKGTKCFRAPELRMGRCNDPKAADIYSAGIILFSLIARGTLPQFETELIDGIDFGDLLANDTYRFWLLHSRLQKSRGISFEEDFKELFEGMTKMNPNERMSIEMIKASRWYNKPCYSPEELTKVMREIFKTTSIVF